ncbi:hypothetical protein AVEN_63284-1 [Araneus ventricosus]|uniref:Uncharacterized protein n=1 Tax=Araneus ventricosus TaxID=182803 RepID=A0A4Y2J523_ARAVE|nr:hypothetical protein AVEN_63284-1 [Araneus ventricosus]
MLSDASTEGKDPLINKAFSLSMKALPSQLLCKQSLFRDATVFSSYATACTEQERRKVFLQLPVPFFEPPEADPEDIEARDKGYQSSKPVYFGNLLVEFEKKILKKIIDLKYVLKLT